MLSIQETTQKTEVKQQLQLIEKDMDSFGEFHPERSSILNVESPALRLELQEMLHTIPLREFLAKSGTTGIAGAAYMVPDKIHSDLVLYGENTDICPLISAQMVDGWQGGDLKVNIVDPDTYKAKKVTSGGAMPTSTAQAMQATLTPQTFAVPILITEDLIEDAAYGLVDWHLKKAAEAIGEFASNLAITVLGTAADGWGTLNSGNAGAGTTAWANIETAIGANIDDRWPPNTVLINPEAWNDGVKKDIGIETAGGAAGDFWQPYADTHMTNVSPVAAGFDFKVGTLDFKQYICDYNHAAYPTDTTAMTACKTIVFDRNASLLTGRKRWMQINNYADPIRDLAGAVVSCRQDSVSLYDDSVYTLTET
jgi:hypothetical protein